MDAEELRRKLGVWATMIQPEHDTSSTTHKKTTNLCVINASLPRTGTASMQEALHTLGFSTYHFSSIFSRISDADKWSAAMDAKYFGRGKRFSKHDFDNLLDQVDAVCDVPSVLFLEELLAYYPEAKVVLVERDLESWYSSFEVILDGVMHPLAVYILRYLDPLVSGRLIGCSVRWVQALTGSNTLEGAKLGSREAYQQHYRNVRAMVPPERLLEYRLGEGWGRLCHFLERGVPAVAFPRCNDSDCLQLAFRVFARSRLQRCFVNVGLAVVFATILFAGTVAFLG